MKLVCSQIVRQVTDWDEVAPPDLTKEWLKAIKNLDAIDFVPISRRKIPEIMLTDCRYELPTAARVSQLLLYIFVLRMRSNAMQVLLLQKPLCFPNPK